MILGLANDTLEFFYRMQSAGIKPSEITLIGIVCACCYSGLVEEDKWFFNAMNQVYGVKPRPGHFGCMINVFRRAGVTRSRDLCPKFAS